LEEYLSTAKPTSTSSEDLFERRASKLVETRSRRQGIYRLRALTGRVEVSRAHRLGAIRQGVWIALCGETGEAWTGDGVDGGAAHAMSAMRE
ncbi:MAG: hypothetical protein QOH96_4134, partial [Blastocatellia bacterium]|nr:hypothetical protein [Blastocatellia bacterium]